MDAEFIDLTAENIADEHLCCIIRMKKPHTGVEAKREWLAARLPEGHVFRKLNTGDCVFIEYAPLETAWVPVVGENYLHIYCLWVLGDYKGKGYGRAAVQKALEFLRESGLFDKVQINYVEENQGAKHLYRSLGFQETGAMEGNEVVMEMDLTGESK